MDIAVSIAALYCVLAAVLLPASEYLRMLGGGVLAFATVYAVAAHQGRKAYPSLALLVVAFATGALLVMPGFPAMGGDVPAAVPLGFLAMQAATLLYAARRWVPRPASTKHVTLVWAWKAGAGTAVGLSLIATVGVTLAFLTLHREAASFLLVYPGYFVGFLAAATIYWALQRISHLAVGRYLIGLLGGTCVYAAVAPVADLADARPISVRGMAVVALLCGALVGPAVALNASDTGDGGSAGEADAPDAAVSAPVNAHSHHHH